MNKHAQTQMETGKVPSISLARTPAAKALQLIEQGKLTRTQNGFMAIGSTGLTYEILVVNGEPICDCKGFTYFGHCYHALAAKITIDGVVN